MISLPGWPLQRQVLAAEAASPVRWMQRLVEPIYSLPMPLAHDLTHSLRRRFNEASKRAGPTDVAIAFYDSMLRYFPRFPLPFRGRVCRVGTREAGLDCWVRLGYSDGSVFEDICVRGIYDSVRKAGLTDVRQVVDLGANVGVSARLWAHLFPQTRITAVEPDQSNFEMCRRNASPDEDRITLIRGFAAGQSGSAYLDPGAQACTHKMVSEPQTESTAIPAYTMADILELGKVTGDIDLLKCDIEGSEQQLFADCAGWIGRVRHMMIELHPPYSKPAFLDDLARAGSGLKVVWSDESPVHPMLFLQS